MKLGRNDLCTCGSGSKYKHCCLDKVESSAEHPSFSYEKLRETEMALMPKIMDYALEQLGDSFVEDAWDDFNDYANEEGFDPENLLNIAFTPWLLYVWPLNVEYAEDNRSDVKISEIITLASLYFGAHLLSEAERQFILAANKKPYRIVEVLASPSDEAIRLRDVFVDQVFEVTDVDGEVGVEVGSVLMLRIAHLEGGPCFTVGNFPFVVRPENLAKIKDLKNRIMLAKKIETFDLETLSKIESLAIGGFLDIVDEQLDEVDLEEENEIIERTDKNSYQ